MHSALAAARQNAGRGWSRSLAPDIEPGRFFEGEDLWRRTTPFALGAVLPFLLLPFAGISATDPRVLVAAALSAALILMVYGLPWSRLPMWSQAVPLLGYFVVVGLLRDASEGHSSIFDPLVALPVVWFALYGTGRQLAVSVLAMGLTLTLPVLIGEAHIDTGDQILRARFAVALASSFGTAIQLGRARASPGHKRVEVRSSRPRRRPSSRSTSTGWSVSGTSRRSGSSAGAGTRSWGGPSTRRSSPAGIGTRT